jgi:hypothetical protein
MCDLQRSEKADHRSLGCVRPKEVDSLIIEVAPGEWSERKRSVLDQMALFDPIEKKLEKIPFVFKYRYRCEDRACRGHTQSIIDWELMELYRRLRRDASSTDVLNAKIRQKYVNELCGDSKDTHFFVGNHSRFPSTFMVLGVFWPPKTPQKTFF